jgi:hypothetical protein
MSTQQVKSLCIYNTHLLCKERREMLPISVTVVYIMLKHNWALQQVQTYHSHKACSLYAV